MPAFTNVPLGVQDVPVELDAEQLGWLDELVAAGGLGADRAEVLRYVFHSWWIENFMQGPKHFDQVAERA